MTSSCGTGPTHRAEDPVRCASMLFVASYPLRSPYFRAVRWQVERFRNAVLTSNLHRAPVAQLDRASGYEPEGREFESPRAQHFFSVRPGDMGYTTYLRHR